MYKPIEPSTVITAQRNEKIIILISTVFLETAGNDKVNFLYNTFQGCILSPDLSENNLILIYASITIALFSNTVYHDPRPESLSSWRM